MTSSSDFRFLRIKQKSFFDYQASITSIFNLFHSISLQQSASIPIILFNETSKGNSKKNYYQKLLNKTHVDDYRFSMFE